VIVAMHRAYVMGADSATAMRLLREYGGSPLGYNGRVIASVVFLWPGMAATFARQAASPLPFPLPLL